MFSRETVLSRLASDVSYISHNEKEAYKLDQLWSDLGRIHLESLQKFGEDIRSKLVPRVEAIE